MTYQNEVKCPHCPNPIVRRHRKTCGNIECTRRQRSLAAARCAQTRWTDPDDWWVELTPPLFTAPDAFANNINKQAQFRPARLPQPNPAFVRTKSVAADL